MPITDAQAVEFGLLGMYAMDMYRIARDGGKLEVPSRVTAAATAEGLGWMAVGLVFGHDRIDLPGPFAGDGVEVCYGYMLRKGEEFVVALRGTDGLVEWLENGLFRPTVYQRVDAAPIADLPAAGRQLLVEQGFRQIYGTLVLKAPADGAGVPLADAVAARVGAAQRVTVVGHSLGAALSTLLAFELAGTLGDRLSACLFASPKVGNQAFADLFEARVRDYRLFNSVIDVIPLVPHGLGYVALARVTLLSPLSSASRISFGPDCNHHVICYCAMLDYERVQRELPFIPDVERPSARCILGPEVGGPSVAKALASLIVHR